MQGIFRTACHLAIIAILVRALLPAGWMPDAHQGLIICSLSPVIHHDGDQKAPAPDGHQDNREECAFAAAAHLASSPDVPQLILPVLHGFIARADSHYAAEVAAHFTPQSPRAPPPIV